MWDEAADLLLETAADPYAMARKMAPAVPTETTETPDRERRCVRVNIPVSMLQLMVTESDLDAPAGYERRCVDGVPHGASLAGVYIDGAYVDPMISLVFRHPSFDPVPPTEMIPEIFPTWQLRRIEG